MNGLRNVLESWLLNVDKNNCLYPGLTLGDTNIDYVPINGSAFDIFLENDVLLCSSI